MKIATTNFCLECDEVFQKSRNGKCPACGSVAFAPASTFVPASIAEREELIEASRVQVLKEPWWWRLPLIGRYFRPFDIAY